jgi:hypothetical protein
MPPQVHFFAMSQFDWPITPKKKKKNYGVVNFFAMSQFDWPITQKKKKNETMEAPQNRRFYFEV